MPIAEDTPAEKAERLQVEKKVKELNLAVVLSSGSYLDPAPTAKTPKPAIDFFKGQRNEVQLAPGRTLLIELPKPAKELVWSVAGGKPRSVPGLAGTGFQAAPEFDYVLCRWEKHGDVAFIMYRRSLNESGPK